MKNKVDFTPASYKKNINVETLLTILREKKDSFWEYNEVLTLLFDTIQFPSDTNEKDSRGFLRIVVKSLLDKGNLNKNTLLKDINIKIANYRQIPLKKYVIHSSISADDSILFKTVKIDNVYIYFSNKYTSRYKTKDWRLTVTQGSLKQYFNQIKFDRTLVVHVNARSPSDAMNEATKALDFIKAIWNYCNNLRFPYSIRGGVDDYPINEILIGPIFTLHDITGKLIDGANVWYTPNYRRNISKFKTNPETEKLFHQKVALIRNALKSNINNDLYSKGLQKYCSALDIANSHASFLSLWNTLEFLTLNEGENQEQLIRRVTFIYKDKDYIKTVLGILKDFRNAYVHTGFTSDATLSYLYTLKRITENLIHFFLFSKYGKLPHNECLQLMSMPQSIPELEKKLKLSQLAFEFQKK